MITSNASISASRKPPEMLAVFHERDTSDKGTFFRDGKRPIDFVLAYKIATELPDEDAREEEQQRATFFDSLLHKRLNLEIEICPDSSGEEAHIAYVKVHATWEALCKYAEVLHTWMPIEFMGETPQSAALAKAFNETSTFCGCSAKCCDYDHEAIPDDVDYFSAPFSRDRASFFRINDHESFFSDSQRSRIVWRILSDAPYGPSHLDFGIQRLLSKSVFTAAYPLHDGDVPQSPVNKVDKENNKVQAKRALLYQQWASFRQLSRLQPLDAVRDYFGEKLGMYFAWLGDYTRFLIFLSIIGTGATIYGAVTSRNDASVSDVCSADKLGCVVMCPLCTDGCGYWALQNSCLSTVLAYLCDNFSTLIYAVCTVLWGTVFLECWKRHEMQLKYDWDVHGFDNREPARPEYEATASSARIDPVTLHEEPYEPLPRRAVRGLCSWTMIAVLVFVVFGTMVSIIIYRTTINAAVYMTSQNDNTHSVFLDNYGRLMVTLSAAVINLIVIIILTVIYDWLANILTEMERPRTQSEFDNSLTIKLFIFQFVNCYGTIFYTAFFRGRFRTMHQNTESSSSLDKTLDYMAEECDPAGCMTDLAIQLATVMVGRQLVGAFTEIALPFVFGRRHLFRCCRNRRVQYPKLQDRRKGSTQNSSSVSPTRNSSSNSKDEKVMTRWEADYELADFSRAGVINEYLEMAIQFGFVTLFGVCFPLSSLFALINNIFEIRLDAYKLIAVYRRPVAVMAEGIGIWSTILRGLLSMAIVSNAMIIAFTSDSVHRLAFDWKIVSPRSIKIVPPPSLNSSQFTPTFFSFITSVMETNNTNRAHLKLDGQCANKAYNDPASIGGFQLQTPNQLTGSNESVYCYYRGLYEPPWSANANDYKAAHWELLVFRLAFALGFVVVVWAMSWFIAQLIPKRPEKVRQFQRYEEHLREKALLSHKSADAKTSKSPQRGAK